MDFSNLKGIMSLKMEQLDDGQKRAAVLSWVASNMKLRWKDYNITGRPTGASAKLTLAGRGGSRAVSSQVDKMYDLELDKDVVARDIVEICLQTMHSMFTDINESKNTGRKNKYMDAINDPMFLGMLLEISIILMSNKLLADKQELYHKFLEVRIKAAKEKKSDLVAIWKDYTNDLIEKDEAIFKTEAVFNQFEQEICSVGGKELIQIATEKALYEFLDKKDFQSYIFGIVDNIRLQITHQPRLFFDIAGD